ncbi:U4/U6.U5 small nuclear ribonucleoprotein [Mortierella sp. GBA30]|nr:U4/U6.U5 small nuclear ribonucleoprotein [Mortierella sp. GBA30]
MPYSPSPERHHDRRGPPKDWDAPEEEEGEISTYGGRRGGASGRDYRDRSRDRRDYRDRDRDRGSGDSRRRDDRYRDINDRDHRDRASGRSDRDRDRDGRRRRSSRSRSRSPYRRGGRSKSRSPRGSRRGHRDDMDMEDGEYRRKRDDSDDEDDKNRKKDRNMAANGDVGTPDTPLEELSPEDEEARMMALMGFGDFDSTKGKKVAGADVSGADIKKQRQYRQYMNRRGGFNR